MLEARSKLDVKIASMLELARCSNLKARARSKLEKMVLDPSLGRGQNFDSLLGSSFYQRYQKIILIQDFIISKCIPNPLCHQNSNFYVLSRSLLKVHNFHEGSRGIPRDFTDLIPHPAGLKKCGILATVIVTHNGSLP